MSLFDQSLEAHVAGRLQEAESGYRAVLAKEPQHADALHLLGIIARDRGASSEAESLIRQAIALTEQARFAGSLGSVLMDQRRAPEAEIAFRRSIELDPNDPFAHYNLAILLLGDGRASEAADALRRVVSLDEGFAGAQRMLGRALHMIGRHDEAQPCFLRAVALNPADAQAHIGLAATLLLQGDPAKAMKACDDALRIDPASFDAQLNLGAALLGLGRLEEAAVTLRGAIELDSTRANAHVNLGMTLTEANSLADAEAAFRRAIELDAFNVDARLGLGRLLERSMRLDEAESAYREGLALRRDDHRLKANLALVLLAKGRYAEGWPLYESRLQGDQAKREASESTFDFPRWNGESLKGKALVVISEQGLGDVLQFCRYLPLLKAKGLKRLTVVCDSAVLRLIESIDEVDACIASADCATLPAHDFWCHMMSLPLRFGTTLDSVPCFVPYLRAPVAAVEIARKRLPTSAPKVGLVWAGEARPHLRAIDAIDKRRSLHARDFLPLLKVPGVMFISLQVGATTRPQLEEIPHELRPFDATSFVKDFGDTAGIIEHLDLVIAVDTSVAHLAGALNKPVWMLSRFDQCWRWLTERDDTPWYPSMRLFRQTQDGHWDSVIENVAQALDEFAEPFRPRKKVRAPRRKKAG